jgi:peptide deformylase
MAILNVLTYPDPRLRRCAEAVKVVDDDTRKLIDDMAETMYTAPGIGLAAIQVDVRKRVIVIDVSEDQSALNVFINPVITASSGEQEREEGCLSVPGIYATVKRAESIVVNALDRSGSEFILEADGVLAVCIQHEIDHLNGKVFVDHLSRIKRDRIRKKLSKQERRGLETLTGSAVA